MERELEHDEPISEQICPECGRKSSDWSDPLGFDLIFCSEACAEKAKRNGDVDEPVDANGTREGDSQ